LYIWRILLIDNNLSFKLTSLFKEKKVVAKHVYGEGLDRAKDFEVWNYTKEFKYTILTKDSDFFDYPEFAWFSAQNNPFKMRQCKY
jgi:predicted nuclease of predicted toxin-antitoxin system